MMGYPINETFNLYSSDAGLTLTPYLKDNAGGALSGLNVSVTETGQPASYRIIGDVPYGTHGRIEIYDGTTYKYEIPVNDDSVEVVDIDEFTAAIVTDVVADVVEEVRALVGEYDAAADGDDVGAASYTSTGGTVINREVAQGSTSTLRYSVLTSSGVAVDVTGRDLRFIISDLDGEELFTLTSGADDINVSGASGNNVAVEVGTAVTGVEFAARYKLWDWTDRDPIAVGAFTVKL